jgi:4-amino-4-deoxy-L-arabinose transferase-like glycosyltransferase
MNIVILGTIWLLSALCDRVWFALDRSIPAWDQADYLTGSLNYLQAMQNFQWNQEWWDSFWQLSTKIPPFTYIVTAVIQQIFGKGVDQATLVMLLFNAVLLISVYGLGTVLFDSTVGLWAVGLCQILPALYRYRLDFLLDYPLAAIVTLCFYCLTIWRIKVSQKTNTSLLWVVAFGLSLGLALMVKQTALFFLLTPIVWVIVVALRQRHWKSLLQLLFGLCSSLLIFGSWYRINWLLILTSGKRASIDSAIAEGDPPLNSLSAWTYYWHQLPRQVSFPLLLVPIFALLLYWGVRGNVETTRWVVFRWLGVFWIGAYLLSSLNMNKDDRYVLPYLPVLTVILAFGLTRFQGLWAKRVRWGTVGLAILLMLFNLFSMGGVLGWMTQAFVQQEHYPYTGKQFPHEEVISQMIKTEPYLRSTLGVLPSTPTINQHNFNYYGALQDFHVYGRQVGTRKKFLEQDARSLRWFLTKSGDQGSVPEVQGMMVRRIETSPNFELNKTWNLPDGSLLKLFHLKAPPLEVKPLDDGNTGITLSQVIVPEKTPPGVPVSVTYIWNGSWKELAEGIVLLTWRHENNSWLHDHGIAMGTLRNSQFSKEQLVQVTEKMAMLPPVDTTPGIYTLEAIYLNRSGEHRTVPIIPKVTIEINAQATPTPAPELDLVTQLRNLAVKLPQGTKRLEQIFDEIGRINQYDTVQDYLVQTQLSMEYRLNYIGKNLDWAYTLALANILQKKVNSAIASLTQVTQLDSQNPYPWAYLAFVHLYNWQPKAAEHSLELALAKNPKIQELKALSGVAALMQGNLVKAWQNL